MADIIMSQRFQYTQHIYSIGFSPPLTKAYLCTVHTNDMSPCIDYKVSKWGKCPDQVQTRLANFIHTHLRYSD